MCDVHGLTADAITAQGRAYINIPYDTQSNTHQARRPRNAGDSGGDGSSSRAVDSSSVPLPRENLGGKSCAFHIIKQQGSRHFMTNHRVKSAAVYHCTPPALFFLNAPVPFPTPPAGLPRPRWPPELS